MSASHLSVIRPREPRSYATPPSATSAASSGEWFVHPYLRTPADAHSGFGRHQRETRHVACKVVGQKAREPNTNAAVKFTVQCTEEGCRQAWVVPHAVD